MTDQVFADGISRIQVVNGTVRIEFVSAVQGSDGTQTLERQARVVMSLRGFVDAYTTMQQTMAKLVESGAVQKSDEKAKPGKPNGAPPAAASPGGIRLPTGGAKRTARPK